MSSNESKSYEEVNKILGEPVIPDFSENTLRMRRNLLIFCSISLFYKLNGLTIATDSIFFGVKFENLTNDAVNVALFALITYHFIHFLLNSFDHFIYLRLRITGSIVNHITTAKFSHEEEDSPDDPKQSTLYNYWLETARRLTKWSAFSEEIEGLKKQQDEFIKLVEENQDNLNQPNIVNKLRNSAPNFTNKLDSLSTKLNEVEKIFTNNRIETSLKRFDKWFWFYQNQQIFRWAIIELGLPIVLGIWSLYLTCPFSFCLK